MNLVHPLRNTHRHTHTHTIERFVQLLIHTFTYNIQIMYFHNWQIWVDCRIDG